MLDNNKRICINIERKKCVRLIQPLLDLNEFSVLYYFVNICCVFHLRDLIDRLDEDEHMKRKPKRDGKKKPEMFLIENKHNKFTHFSSLFSLICHRICDGFEAFDGSWFDSNQLIIIIIINSEYNSFVYCSTPRI